MYRVTFISFFFFFSITLIMQKVGIEITGVPVRETVRKNIQREIITWHENKRVNDGKRDDDDDGSKVNWFASGFTIGNMIF